MAVAMTAAAPCSRGAARADGRERLRRVGVVLVSAEFTAGSRAASHRSHARARGWVCVEMGGGLRGAGPCQSVAHSNSGWDSTTSSTSRGALRTSVSLRVHTWRCENRAVFDSATYRLIGTTRVTSSYRERHVTARTSHMQWYRCVVRASRLHL